MSNCEDHSHNGNTGEGIGHDHPEYGISYTLYQKIDIQNIQCLNEAVVNSGKSVFKAWEERLSVDKFVESDVDEELLFNIPFTDQIKLKGIIVIGGENGHHPNRMRLYKNRPHMTFDDCGSKADQEFELHPDPSGTLEYNPNIHFPGNFGEEVTRIYYIGLKGEYTKAHQHGVTICCYESSPQFSDHKAKVADSIGRLLKAPGKSSVNLVTFWFDGDSSITGHPLNCVGKHRKDALCQKCLDLSPYKS